MKSGKIGLSTKLFMIDLCCLRRAAYLFLLLVFTLLSTTNAATSPQLLGSTETNCAGMWSLNIPDVEIVEVKLVFGDPEYCSVIGYLKSRMVFEVLLPTNWNGKMYFRGNGGFAGELADTSPGLGRGYATISTDTGHQGDGLDATWALDNRTAEIDYAYRAVHQVVVLGKKIIQAYYKRAPKFSYFDGCSNGGRQALMEAEKYPADFNGIAAGCPALDWTGFMIGANWDMQALQATENSNLIPFEKFQVIGDAVLEECDAIDGLTDGLIDDPRKCHFKAETLLCQSGDGPDCLTQPQVDALKKIDSGPRDSSGHPLYPGFPLAGAVSDFWWAAWLFSNPDFPAVQFSFQDQFFRFMAFNKDNPDFDWRTFDFDTDPQRMNLMARILNATDTDLSRFQELGGKLLLWQGWSDSAIAPTRVIDYYNEVRKRLGRQNAENTIRLFMAPGMAHCFGGTGPNEFDYLTALEQWVEQGVAPESIEATHYGENGPDRTRPLCPFPKVARYNGSGSMNRAANFTCVAPEAGKKGGTK